MSLHGTAFFPGGLPFKVVWYTCLVLCTPGSILHPPRSQGVISSQKCASYFGTNKRYPFTNSYTQWGQLFLICLIKGSVFFFFFNSCKSKKGHVLRPQKVELVFQNMYLHTHTQTHEGFYMSTCFGNF